MKQQAYVAQLIYRIRCEGLYDEQYEEQFRLIFADDERAALAAAQKVGAADEAVFADRRGRMIQWQLIAVKDLQPVTLNHGSLLSSRVREVEPVAAPIWSEDELSHA